MIAFKIDENLPIEVRELLRRGGFDALTVVQTGGCFAATGAQRHGGRALAPLTPPA